MMTTRLIVLKETAQVEKINLVIKSSLGELRFSHQSDCLLLGILQISQRLIIDP